MWLKKTLLKNDRYLVTKGWGRSGATTVYIKELLCHVKATEDETATLSNRLTELAGSGIRITADNPEVQQLALAMAARVERRYIDELGKSLWHT